jgi:hypothetical protein
LERKRISEEAVFSVLNPEGIKPEIELHPLSPRLDTLIGKKVHVINLHGPDEQVIESVATDLKAAVPGCNVALFRPEGGQGGPPLTEGDWAKMLDCDAAILGNNY